jgi:hypothetical protein
MKKAILKVYVIKRIRPLFVAEIYDDVDKTVEKLIADLNDRSMSVITFGSITFKKELFKWLKVIYK